MIEAKGTVTALDGAYAIVHVDAGGCGRCHEDGGCGGHNLGAMLCRSPREYRVLNPGQSGLGERVTIVVSEGVVKSTALMAYGFPLLLLFAGAALGTWLYGDEVGIAGGVLGLLAGMTVSGFLQRKKNGGAGQEPFIRH